MYVKREGGQLGCALTRLQVRRSVQSFDDLAKNLYGDVLLVEDALKLVLAQLEASERLERRHGGGATATIEQRRTQDRDLAEVVSGPERCPLPAAPPYLGTALQDHEEFVGELPFLADGPTRLEAALPSQLRDVTWRRVQFWKRGTTFNFAMVSA